MSSDEDPRLPLSPPFVDPTTAKGYVLTGKIMMSAIIIVFAVVVIMLILHVYARWYILRNNRRRRRRTHLVFYVDSANSDPVSSGGLDPALLKSLPVFEFSSSVNVEEEEKLPECAVCLSEFEDGEKGRVLPKCKHSFHVDCIDMWFHSHSTCPLCRSPVDGEFQAEGNDSVEVVVELAESTRGESTHLESTHLESGSSSGYCADCRPGPSSSSSFGARRKGLDLVGVSVEIPARTSSFRFPNSDELGLSSPASQGYKSPTSRLLKRILSREKKPIPSPTSSSGIGTSCSELADIEEGRVLGTRTSRSQATTPR